MHDYAHGTFDKGIQKHEWKSFIKNKYLTLS